ncbi:hypothetical protein AB4Z29_05465 [Paenibacillus sp. 2TAB23]|uniref:hypothetical protein n=1 Tax=Paenibacillus sp. 2TAB23 TaxID=3233004 RepID=UPI003F9B846B
MTQDVNIHHALAAVWQATNSTAESWVIGGSASLMLRGLPLAAMPRDLDLYCDDQDVANIHKALEPYAVDKPTLSVTGMYRSVLSRYRIKGVQVELVGGFRVEAGGSVYETKVRETLLPLSDWIDINVMELVLPVVPLAHELWFNFLRDRMDRVELIVKAFSAAPEKHLHAFAAIEQSNTFTEEAKHSLRRLLANREAGE